MAEKCRFEFNEASIDGAGTHACLCLCVCVYIYARSLHVICMRSLSFTRRYVGLFKLH